MRGRIKMVYHRTNAQIKPTPLVGPWRCNVCGEKFVNPKAHVDHMGSHSVEYPSSCLLCLSRFKTSDDLVSHDCAANNKTRSTSHNSSTTNPSNPSITQPQAVITTEQSSLDAYHNAPLPGSTLEKASASRQIVAAKEKTLTPLILPVVDNHLKQSESSPSAFEDGPDEEEILEAALNPVRRRSRSSSFETNNNNQMTKDEFFVKDPWQASSALMVVNDDKELLPPSLEPSNVQISIASTSQQVAASSQNEQQDSSKYQNVGKRIRIPNSRYFGDNSITAHPNSARISNNNLKESKVKMAGNSNLSPCKVSNKRSSSETVVSKRREMPQELASPGGPSALPLNAPLLDLVDLVGQSEAFELAIQNQDRSNFNDYESSFDNPSEKSDTFPLFDLNCKDCKLGFVDYSSWKEHAVSKHILCGKMPIVVMEKLSVVEVDSVGPYQVATSDGKLSICRKPVVYETDSSESSQEEHNASETEFSSGSETRKEALKLTLCRREGQYELKRKSTESIASTNDDMRQSPTSPIIEDSNQSVQTYDSINSNDPDPELMVRNAEQLLHTEKLQLERQTEKHSDLSAPSVRNSQIGYKCRFKQAVLTVQRNLELEKKRNAPTDAENSDVGESRQATTAADENPITSSPVIAKSSMPSLVSSPQQDRFSASATIANPHQNKMSHGNTDMTTGIAQVSSNKATGESNEIRQSTLPIPNNARRESADESRSVDVITELGINKTRQFLHQTVITKEEPVESMHKDQVIPAQSPCDNAILPDTNVAEKTAASKENNEHENEVADDDENRLVIHVSNEGPDTTKKADCESQTKENDPLTPPSEQNDERTKENDKDSVKDISEPPKDDELVVRVQDNKKTNGDDISKERSTVTSQDDEDFPCSQCEKVFSCNDDLQSHFSEVHVRLAHSAIIQEPESPFPTITVRGTSSIFEDEVEESEPYPVASAAETLFPSNTLSNLLSRRRSAEAERLMVEPIITSYMHGHERGTALVHSQGGPTRPGFPVLARGFPLPTTTRSSSPMMPQDYNMLRQAPKPANRFATPSPQSRMQPPYRPGYPTALHQALVNQQHSASSQSTIAPPPRPQLRPISNAQIRGGPIIHHQLPNRPPLTRGPPAAQGASPYTPHSHPQSILRASPPTSHQQQQQQNPQSILRAQPPLSPQQELENLIQKHQVRLRQTEGQMNIVGQQMQVEPSPARLVRLQEDKDKLMMHFEEVSKQLQSLQAQQQQLLLQRQHMHQLQLQQQQQQQMRQQQLQQRTPQSGSVVVSNPSVLQKRSSMDDMVVSASQPKQPRLESAHAPGDRVADSAQQNNPDNLSVKLPNGVTLSMLSHSSDPKPSPPSGPQLVVAPGAHSGGSSSSRNSSAPVSPAMVSPGTVATRLANSGITLTPASPAPLPLTPPANPVLSPISDCASSPRGSPRIPVNTVIQRVPPVGSPVAAARSPHSSSPHQADISFAVPKAPAPVKPNISATVVTNPNAERPERPPTIDLTNDEVQNHNAQMRATGGGMVSQAQINQHQNALQRLRAAGIAGSNQPPTATNLAHANKPQCPHCHTQFVSVDVLNEHIVRIHRQGQGQQHAPTFFPRPTQVAVRRSSPNANSTVLGPRLEPPRPVLLPRGNPPPPNTQLMQQIRGPVSPLSRSQDHTNQSRTSDEADKFVIPLLNLGGLDLPKLRALNDIGVVSFIPLQGITKLGIPIMRLRPDVSLGHFPHDTAIEIGPIRRIPESAGSTNHSIHALIPSPNRGNTTTTSRQPAPLAQSVRHPQSVMSPPIDGTRCTDRNCPDLMRRSSPIGTIHHSAANVANSIAGHVGVPMHNHPPSNNSTHFQQQSATHHHESFLGSQGQLIVTPVNRN